MDTNNITFLSNVNDVAGDFVIKVRLVRVWKQFIKENPSQVYSIESVMMDESVFIAPP
jgi:hypothetical protein